MIDPAHQPQRGVYDTLIVRAQQSLDQWASFSAAQDPSNPSSFLANQNPTNAQMVAQVRALTTFALQIGKVVAALVRLQLAWLDRTD